MQDIIDFSGGLNQDDAILPKGDYTEAHNVHMEAGLNGGVGSIKKFESTEILASGLLADLTDGKQIASTVDFEGNIYVLSADATIAKLFKVEQSGTVTELIEYNHNSSTIESPDIVYTQGTLTWNYYGDGAILNWYIPRGTGIVVSDVKDLFLIKSPPALALSVTENSAADTYSLIETKEYQFAARYVYDTGDVSALGPISNVYGGINDVESISIDLNGLEVLPTYVTSIEYVVREGNTGGWFLIDDRDTASSSLTFRGTKKEAIPSTETSKQYDFAPVGAKTLELVDNRIFAGNLNEDLGGDKGAFVVTAGDIVSVFDEAGGSSYAYYSATATNNPLDKRPFPNASRYQCGFVYYDKFQRTRGVEAYGEFTTGSFDKFSVANVTLTKQAGSDIPDWAETWQVVVSKNLDRDFSYEGYSDNIYFILDVPERQDETVNFRNIDEQLATESQVTASQVQIGPTLTADFSSLLETGSAINNNNSDFAQSELNKKRFKTVQISGGEARLSGAQQQIALQNIPKSMFKYFVVSIASMQKAGFSYQFQAGDVITGKFNIDNSTSTLRIIGQEGDLLYCDPEDLLNATSIKTGDNMNLINFEIQSPSESTLEEVFYATGDVYPISELTGMSDGNSINKELQGDMHYIEETILTPSENPNKELVGRFSQSSYVETDGVSGEEEVRAVINTTDHEYIDDTIASNGSTIVVAESGNYLISWRARATNEDGGTTVSGRAGIKEERTGRLIQDKNVIDIISGDATVSDSLSVSLEAGQSIFVFFTAGTVPTTYRLQDCEIYIAKSEDVIYYERPPLIGSLDHPEVAYKESDARIDLDEKSYIFRKTNRSKILQTWNADLGKPFVPVPKFEEKQKTQRFRWTGKVVEDSPYSRLSSWAPSDLEDLPSEMGFLTALKRTTENQADGGVLIALCKNDTASIYVSQRMIRSGDGSQQLIQTDNVVGSVNLLQGNSGCQHKDSLAGRRGRWYWWDENKKTITRYTREGLSFVSDIKMTTYFNEKSGNCVGFYDPYKEHYHISFDSDGYSTYFNGKRWKGTTDLTPVKGGVSFGNKLHLASGDELHVTLGSGFNTFLGSLGSPASITLSMNTLSPVELSAISVVTDDYIDWDANPKMGVKSGVMDVDVFNSSNQSTSMDDEHFIQEDGVFYMTILRDESGAENKYTGPPMIGTVNSVRLTLKDNLIQDNLRSIIIYYEPSRGHFGQ